MSEYARGRARVLITVRDGGKCFAGAVFTDDDRVFHPLDGHNPRGRANALRSFWAAALANAPGDVRRSLAEASAGHDFKRVDA